MTEHLKDKKEEEEEEEERNLINNFLGFNIHTVVRT